LIKQHCIPIIPFPSTGFVGALVILFFFPLVVLVCVEPVRLKEHLSPTRKRELSMVIDLACNVNAVSRTSAGYYTEALCKLANTAGQRLPSDQPDGEVFRRGVELWIHAVDTWTPDWTERVRRR
jgi:hypothetical protein